MAAISTNNPGARTQLSNAQLASFILIAAVVVTILQWSNLLPAALHRLPEEWIPQFANWMDTGFNFIRYTLGLETLTRWFAEGPLQFLLDTTANILFGKRRWPNFEPIPWSSVAAVAAVIGYYLGGWRLSVLAGGTFVWTALIGQWKIAMQTLSVIAIACRWTHFCR